jgi:hypothetical protein
MREPSKGFLTTRHCYLSYLFQNKYLAGEHVVTKSGPPFEAPGAVSFKDGRLAWVSKEWDQGLDQTASVEVICRLIGLIGQEKCVTATTATEEPSFRSSDLVIQCSRNRQIEVSVSETPGQANSTVTMREIYGLKR